MRAAAIFLVVSLAAIAAAWWWLGRPIAMPPSPLQAGAKLDCVSYTPFRRGQTPLDENIVASPAEIDADFKLLASVTDCVRTYAVDEGLDQVPRIAKAHGLKVVLGLWIGRDPAKNALQIERGIALANAYHDTVRLLVVGNETLLRGEISPASLGAILQTVRSRVAVPVTYADVWEFWQQNAALAKDIDVITIHILPYWENEPVAAADAAAHVAAIYGRMKEEFPGKPIMIGETGWPSQGRMRAGARPSPANEARVLGDTVAWARRAHVAVNYIEAFDQPWKRVLEGTAGGFWGLFDAGHEAPKFDWGKPVSDHPHWPIEAIGGCLLALAAFAAAALGRRTASLPPRRWAAVAAIAVVGGVPLGLAVEYWLFGARNAGEDFEAAIAIGVAVALPVAAAAAVARQDGPAHFSRLLGGAPALRRLSWWLALLAALLTVEAMAYALGLVFDPRYRGFPASTLAGGTFALLMVVLPDWRVRGGAAERCAAAVLAVAAVAIVVVEGWPINTEAVAYAVTILILAGTLAGAPVGRGRRATG